MAWLRFPLYFVGLFLCLQGAGQTASIADAGTGNLRNYISWFDWSGANIQSGSSRSFTTTDGLSVLINFSTVSGPVLVPSVMKTTPSAILWQYYDFADPSIQPALFTQGSNAPVSIQMTITVTRNGLPVPFTFVLADAEASNLNEQAIISTTAGSWKILEFLRNSSQSNNPVPGCGGQTITMTQTFGGTDGVGQIPVMGTDGSGSINVSVALNRSSASPMAMAFGILSGVDRGDLPAGYTSAQHAIPVSTANTCNFNPPYPSATPGKLLFLGDVPGDADPVITTNDNANGVDEDGVANFPLYDGSGTYRLDIKVNNNLPGAAQAYLRGWYDYDRSGVFGAGEVADAVVAAGSNIITLTWTGLPPTLPPGPVSAYAFRIRVASAVADLASVAGFAKDGEVEDYLVETCTTKPDFSFRQELCSPKTVNFKTSASNIQSVKWFFGDGQTNTGSLGPAVTYANFGAYTVQLIVHTTLGCKDTVTKTIQVMAEQANSLISTNDTTICTGGQVTIRPATLGLSNCFRSLAGASVLTDNISVSPASTTVYYYNALVTGPNLVINGNFSAGNSAFSSQYPYVTINTSEGQYGVEAGVPAWANFMSNCSDHSAAGGPMMVVNGDHLPGKVVWSQTVTVAPHTNYSFSAWIQSLYAVNPANLRLMINGSLIGDPILAMTSTCQWKNFWITWNSGVNTSAEISIINNNTIVQGNDFALDDIFFGSSFVQTDSVVVSVTPRPGISITENDTTICAGSSIQLHAVTNAGTMAWTPALFLNDPSGPNPIASPTSTTKYYAVADPGAACSSRDSITIYVLNKPVVKTMGDTSICSGASVQLRTIVSDATSVSWSPSIGLDNSSLVSPFAAPLVTTDYIVTASNNGVCISTDTIRITVIPKPTIDLPGDTTLCSGASLQLFATTSAASVQWLPSAYLNNPHIVNPVSTPLTTIKYYALADPASACSTRDSILIQLVNTPQLQSIADTSLCAGTSIQLLTTSSNATYFSWQPATGLNDPFVASPIATPSVLTEYIVTATNNGACPRADTVKVDVRALPLVSVSNDTTVCGNASVQLQATGGVGYSWSPAAGLSSVNIPDPVATPGSTSSYIVNVLGANGCRDTGSVTISVIPLPVFTIVPADQTVCEGTAVNILASGGDSYNWTPAPGIVNTSLASVIVTPAVTTTYSVRIDHATCRLSQTLNATVRVNPLPRVSVSKTNDIDCSNSLAQLMATGGNSYEWSPSLGLSGTQIPNPVASLLATTTYKVKVGTAEGCFVEETITVNFLGGDKDNMHIPNAFTPNNDGLNDEFRVTYAGSSRFEIKIYNRWGQMVFRSTDPSRGWDGIFKGQKQGTGSFVYVISGEGVCGGTLIKKGSFLLIR